MTKFIPKDNADRKSYKPLKLIHDKDFTKQIRRLNKRYQAQPVVVDQYLVQLEELFLLRNPKYRFSTDYKEGFENFLQQHASSKPLSNKGHWFYFPWSNTVVHFLQDSWHQELRTGRNRNLINLEEQLKFYNSTIGILGMSVGSHVALTIAMTGGARHIKLADPDALSGSNLNRIRTGFVNLEIPKTIAVARQIYEINPYAIVEIYPEGLTGSNIQNFLKGSGKLDLLVEEMDNPYFKLEVRVHARKYGIPVIMAADNADSIIVDVERFDKNKKLPLLHGILGKITPRDFKHLEPKNLPNVLAKMAGANFSTVRMLESVMQVGKTLYSWPQLGNAATLCGAVLTYLARSIVIGARVPSGRTDFNVGKFFLPPSKAELKRRDKILKNMGIK